MKPIDPKDLRSAFGRFMTGVTVVTTRDDEGRPVGFTANSFTSVSLDPPLLLVCPGKFLSSFGAFSKCSHFCVSVLEEGQTEVANTFAGFKGDRFAKIEHRQDVHGIPAPMGAIATFSCRTHNTIPAGDHVILIGEVVDFVQANGAGLGYAEGQFFSLTRERSARDPAAATNIGGALVRHNGQILLEDTADGYRLPQCVVPERAAFRKSIGKMLDAQGLSVRFGAVYSVFDDPDTGTHFAYLLADADEVAPNSGLTAIAPAELPGLKFSSEPVANMMVRYSNESSTGNLNCYLGDTVSGETHALTEEA